MAPLLRRSDDTVRSGWHSDRSLARPETAVVRCVSSCFPQCKTRPRVSAFSTGRACRTVPGPAVSETSLLYQSIEVAPFPELISTSRAFSTSSSSTQISEWLGCLTPSSSNDCVTAYWIPDFRSNPLQRATTGVVPDATTIIPSRLAIAAHTGARQAAIRLLCIAKCYGKVKWSSARKRTLGRFLSCKLESARRSPGIRTSQRGCGQKLVAIDTRLTLPCASGCDMRPDKHKEGRSSPILPTGHVKTVHQARTG